MTAPRSTRVPAPAGGGLLEPLRDEGRALDGSTRADFERAMGASFGDVVVHSGAASTASTESWDAAAYTVGRHIVFNSGRYDPGTMRGRTLLAHELTHVAQQRAGGGDLELGFRMPGSSLPVLAGSAETEASQRASGSRASSGGVTGTGVGVAMQSKTAERASAPAGAFEYRDAGGTVKRVSKEEGERLRADAARKLRIGLVNAKDMAALGRSINEDHIKETQATSFGDMFTSGMKFAGTVSNMVAGTAPPSPSMWHHPTHAADLGLAALARGDLKEAASALRRATMHLDDAQKEWTAYTETSIGGAQSVIEQGRSLRRPLNVLHGVLTEVAQIVDTGLWVADVALTEHELPQGAPGPEGALRPKGAAAPPAGLYTRLKAAAAEAGFVDPVNGALSITGKLHKTFDESDRSLATEPESDDILTENDLWQLGGQTGAQAVLAWVGVTEVKYLATGLKIAGAVGAIKAVTDTFDRHRRKDDRTVDAGALAKDPDFWLAIGNLGMTAIGRRGSRVGNKLVRILVAGAPSLFAGTREFARLVDAYGLPEGPKRNEEIRTAVIGLIRVVLQGIVQAATQRVATKLGEGGTKKTEPTQGESGAGEGAGSSGSSHQNEAPAGPSTASTQPKPAPKPVVEESAAKAAPKPVVEEPIAKPAPKAVPEESAAQVKPAVEESAAKPAPKAVPEEPAAQAKPAVEESAAKPAPKAVPEEPAAQAKPVVEESAAAKPKSEEPVSHAKKPPVEESEGAAPKSELKQGVEEHAPKVEPKPSVDEPADQAAKPKVEEPAAPAAPAKPSTEESPAKTVAEPTGAAKSTEEPTAQKASTATKEEPSAPSKTGETESPSSKPKGPSADEPATAGKSSTPAPDAPVIKPPAHKPAAALRNAWKRLKKTTSKEAVAQKRVTTAEERVAAAKKVIVERQQTGKKARKSDSNELERAERLHQKAVKALKKTSEANATQRAKVDRLEKYDELKRIWAEHRFELWRERAREEIAARKAGTSRQHEYSPERAAEQEARIAAAQKELGTNAKIGATPRERLHMWDEKNPKKGQGFEKPELAKDPVDPIKDLSDADLAKLAATGETPAGFTREVEHRIPQRVAKMLVDSGLPVDLAVKLAKLTDKSNLDPTTGEFHAGSDASRRGFIPKAPDGTPLGSMDARQRAPLMSATPDEIAAIADALRKTPGVDLDKKHVIDRGRPARKVEVAGETPGAPKAIIEVPKEEPLKMSWREILEAAGKSHGASAKWDPL